MTETFLSQMQIGIAIISAVILGLTWGYEAKRKGKPFWAALFVFLSLIWAANFIMFVIEQTS